MLRIFFCELEIVFMFKLCHHGVKIQLDRYKITFTNELNT